MSHNDKSRRRKRRVLRVHRPFTVGKSHYHHGIGQSVIPINGVDPDQPGGGEWLVAWVLENAVPDAEKWAARVAKAMNRTRP